MVCELKEALHQRPEALFALLHGSFIAEGPFRDIDLAVYVNSSAAKGVSFREYEIDLAVALTLKVHMSVDVRVLNDAPVAFRYHALKGLVLLVRDTEFLDEFRARTWDEYFDFASFARRYLREAIGG
ncbi:MAG: nucleotidyltransferase domain-containing protein [Nitrospiraceae bacterium]